MTKLSVKQPSTTSAARQAQQPATGLRSGEAGPSPALTSGARADQSRPVQAPVQDAVSNEPQAEQARVTGRATGPALDARLASGKALADYRKRYGDLDKDLAAELSGTHLAEVKTLLSRGELSPAEKLNRAFRGFGTDESAVLENLNGLSQTQLAEVKADYQKRYGSTLQQDIRNEMSGRERDLALRLLDRGRLSLAEQIHFATHGGSTDEQAVFDALQKASPEEREAMRADPRFVQQLGAELGATDLERANLLLENGALTREEQLHYAMAGAGTGEQAVREALRDLSPAQRDQLRTSYRQCYGRALDDDLRAELGKRDLWAAEDALAPEPETLRERLDRAELRAARERDSGMSVPGA